MEKTYLELSEDAGSAHKFYEVTVDGNDMTIRYGRIGTDGATSAKSFGSHDAALKEAQKKINSKKKSGYGEAIQGVRKKRAISRRSVVSAQSTTKSKAPVLWKFNSTSTAFGIYISDDACWVGNEKGEVYKLDHEGKVMNQYQLPDGVKCIIADNDWIYVGCDDGNVYDLTGKIPRKAYEIREDVDIYWLDINHGLLGVSDSNGFLTAINYEDEEQWQQKSAGLSGWMIRIDEKGYMYHGHSQGVTCYYGWDGKKQWEESTNGSVLFGWRMDNTVLAGTGRSEMQLFDNAGKTLGRYRCDASVYSCATAPNNEFVFGGDSSSSIYCFDDKGNRLWKLATSCGSALSMQYHKEKLYIVTTDGSLTCIDATKQAIEDAQQGKLPDAKEIKAPEKKVAIAQSDVLETAAPSVNGIHLKCIKEGAKLRVRVLTQGYHNDWNVQFPKNLREENAEYLVDDIRESSAGFYRTYGNIYKKA